MSKVEKGEAKQVATAPLPEGEKLRLRMTVREGQLFHFHANADGKEWKAVGAQELDRAFLPPWDRAPRAGLVVAGKAGEVGKFDSVELRYELP